MDASRKTRRATLILAAALCTFVATAILPAAAVAEICPPDDPLACLVRCRIDKLDCFSGCRARKLACLSEVRAEAQECRLECRLSGGTNEEISACKRECTANALTKARDVCRLGKPSCVRLCHPESCPELCGIVDAPAPGDTVPDGDGTNGLEGEAPVCEPPVDRECLGACGRELRRCATAVHEDAVACLETCADLRGWERLGCVGGCVEDAREDAATCKRDFRQCVGDCGVPVDEVDPPVSAE